MSKIKPILFAHRGASGYEHENSFAAFNKAIELGADGLETDVFEIATGELILYHDNAITLPGDSSNTPISKLTSQDLEKIILPNGEKIPLLEEFFKRFSTAKTKNGENIQFSIDIQNTKAGSSIAKKVMEYSLEDRVFLCSTTPSIVFKKLRTEYPAVKLVASNCENYLSLESCSEGGKFGALNIYAFNFQNGHLTNELYEIVKSTKAKVFMWDLHNDEDLKQAILQFELDAVYSNYPDRARKIINELMN